jgi:hypothetical protein
MYENTYYTQTTYEHAHGISNQHGGSSSHNQDRSTHGSSQQSPTWSELERTGMKLYVSDASDLFDPSEHTDPSATPQSIAPPI